MPDQITHQERGLVVTEHFDDPAKYGFAPPAAEPVKPDEPPATSGGPDAKEGA